VDITKSIFGLIGDNTQEKGFVLRLKEELYVETSLKVGDIAPEFSLAATTKEKIALSDYRGKKSVLVAFYGMDFTPG
jgi:peroxiredoxin